MKILERAARTSGGVTTLVSISDGTGRLLQVRQTAGGPQLLTVQAQPSDALPATVNRLPAPPGRVILVLPKVQVLTRYLTLPTDDLGELATMARYAVAETLPYPLEECTVAVQLLHRGEQQTKVLALILSNAVFTPMLALLRRAGLEPQAVALASEGIARWHQALSPGGATPRLVVEMLGRTLELIIAHEDQVLALRSVPLPAEGEPLTPWLITHAQEAVRTYAQERAGLPVQAVTVSGPELSSPGVVAALAEHLGLPVAVADPLGSPFVQALAGEASSLTAVPWSDLFGLASSPEPVTVNLLPAEIRQAQHRQAIESAARRALGWAALCLWLAAGVCGLAAARNLRFTQVLVQQQAAIAGAAQRAEQLAQHLSRLPAAQAALAARLRALTELQAALPAAVTLEQVTLEGNRLTVVGSAPGLADVTTWMTGAGLTMTQAMTERGGRLRFTLEGTL